VISKEINAIESHSGKVYNVGGGLCCSVSLAKLTEQCVKRAGRLERLRRGLKPTPWRSFYMTDNTAVTAATGWHQEISLEDIFDWSKPALFGPGTGFKSN